MVWNAISFVQSPWLLNRFYVVGNVSFTCSRLCESAAKLLKVIDNFQLFISINIYMYIYK